MVRCTDGRVKPSWRMASSIEPMERSSGPLPWLWPVVGLLARSGFREFKGWPRDNKTIRPVWPKPPFSSVDRQESQPALVVLTRPQPQAPNLLGATGTGQHTGLSRALAGKNQLKNNLSVPRNSAEFFSERNLDRKSTRLNSSHLGISYA